MIREAIATLANGEDIGYETAKTVMNEIMCGEASDIQKSAYLTALSMKGETIEEITGSAEEMRNHCVRLLNDMDVLEIVGTGGGSFQFLQHFHHLRPGDRGRRRTCGKAWQPGRFQQMRRCGCAGGAGRGHYHSPRAKKRGAAEGNRNLFLFAQKYHTAMRYVGPVRKELGIRTVFNILGPLANPAGANMEVMGVYNKELVEPLARVLVKSWRKERDGSVWDG